MDIIKIDQVSIAAQAGALDASLAFTANFQQHQELIMQTALSGLRGVQDILSATSLYGTAITALQETSQLITAANDAAAKDPFQTGSSTTVSNAVNSSRQSQSDAVNTVISSAKSSASTATNGTTAGTDERTAGNKVVSAADSLLTANSAFRGGDPSKIQQAYQDAVSAQSAAQTAWNNAPAARKAAAKAVLDAANSVVSSAQQLVTLRDSSIGKLAGVTPATTDLANGYTLSTWGSTGYVTIADANGKGVIVSPDGTVDSIDGSGKGWKFNTTSTFVLPGDTKVTFNPGSPADILVSRGIHAFTVDGLKSGQSPATSAYDTLNGRVEDRSSNDGYIIAMNGDAGHWKLNGSALGDETSREVVATSALNNELKLDPTDVSIPKELQDFMNQTGLTSLDYDGDGKLNNDELAAVASNIASFIKTMQDAYEAALARLSQANSAIDDLNQLLDLLRKQNDSNVQGKVDESASSKAELQAVERRLLEALEALRGKDGAAPVPAGGIEGNAENVLQKLTDIVQQGGVQTTTSKPATPPQSPAGTSTGETSSSNAIETLGTPTGGQGDKLGDSLRRAGRLLSGLLGGGNLNILELPPEKQTTPAGDAQGATGTAADGTTGAAGPALGELAAALDDLIGQLKGALGITDTQATNGTGGVAGLAGLGGAGDLSGTDNSPGIAGLDGLTSLGGLGSLTPQDLTAGLEGLLSVLSGLQLVDTSSLTSATSAQDLLSTLQQLLAQTASPQDSSATQPLQTPPQTDALSGSPTTGQVGVGNGPAAAASLLSFLGTLAQFGSALEAVAPQAKQTTPGQLEKASTASLPTLSVVAQQVLAVLSGQAEIGSAGADQSSGSSTQATGGLTNLSRAAEQLALVLAGLAELGSAGASQSTGTAGAKIPTSAELRLGLQSFLTALAAFGVFAVNSQSGQGSTTQNTSTEGTTGVSFSSGNTQAIDTITSNFFTDPELMKVLQENLNRAIQTQQSQLNRASTLFEQSQQVVQKFVSLIKQDDLIRDVVKSDDLSDEQQKIFDERMRELRKDWGVDWGTSDTDSRTPATQNNLVTKAVQSGMMV